jgi:hypothetical protein
MDRSFLSDASVVEASKLFVCARLLTYEDAAEGKFLEGVFRGRSGQLENTVFAIFAPDGKTQLTRGGRSPGMAFGTEDVSRMVAEMKRIAAQNTKQTTGADEAPTMPYMEDVRRALDTAACDMLPMAVVVTRNAAERTRLEQTLRPIAFSDAFRGRFIWAFTEKRADLSKIDGVAADAALVLVEPDSFGLKGDVLAETADTGPKAIEAALRKALEKQDPGEKDAGQHIRAGHRAGVHWETEIPVTDPGGPPHR